MKGQLIRNLVILSILLPLVSSLNYGDTCVRSPDTCDSNLNLQCTEVSAGKFICQCDGLSFLSPTIPSTCLKYRDFPGEGCESGTDQCKNIEGAACVDETGNHKCRCQENTGYFEFPLGVKCSKFSLKPKDDCEIGEGSKFCDRIEGSHCALLDGNSNTKCVCDENSGYFEHPNGNNCVEFAKVINDFCEPNALRVCERLGNTICSNKDGISFRCVCDIDFYEDPQESICQKLPILPSEKCLVQEHCQNIPNSNCLCLEENATHCTCECSPNFDTSLGGNICIPRAEFVGDFCESDTQCLNLDNTACVILSDGIKRCMCTGNDFVPSFSRKSCLPIVHSIGEYCEDSAQCEVVLGSYSACIGNNTCNCLPGSVANTFLNQCLPLSNINETCSDSVQCTGNLGPESICEETCKCKPNAGFLNGRCYKKIPLNERCGHSEECILYNGNYSSCVSGECQCLPSAVQFNSTCYPYKEIGDVCDSWEECNITIPGGATCENGRCVCEEDFYEDPEEGICQELPALPSDKCLEQEHCQHIPDSYCLCQEEITTNCTCECSPNFDINLEGDICIPRTKFVGDVCESDTQCLNLDNTVCMTVSDGTKRCLCKGNGNFVPSFSRQYCLPIVHNIGEYCEDSTQCEVILGSYSTCIGNNTCNCLPGSVANEFLNQCLSLSRFNETCSESAQCTGSLGPESICMETCRCKQDAGFLNGRCYKKVPLNEICRNSEECILYSGDHSSCEIGECQCLSSAVQFNNMCYPYKKIGDACNNWEECYITIPGGATCEYGRCVCEYPKTPNTDNTTITTCSSAQTLLTVSQFYPWLLIFSVLHLIY